MAKRRAVLKPDQLDPDPDRLNLRPKRDPRQLEIGAPPPSVPPPSVPPPKPAAPPDPAAVAKRAVARRGVVNGRVKIVVAVKVGAAEALSERAIRETRNVEDVAAEILEREVGR
jgi:hypothetical protein